MGEPRGLGVGSAKAHHVAACGATYNGDLVGTVGTNAIQSSAVRSVEWAEGQMLFAFVEEGEDVEESSPQWLLLQHTSILMLVKHGLTSGGRWTSSTALFICGDAFRYVLVTWDNCSLQGRVVDANVQPGEIPRI